MMNPRSKTQEQTHAIVMPPRSVHVAAQGTSDQCVGWVDQYRELGYAEPVELITVKALTRRRKRAAAQRQARDRRDRTLVRRLAHPLHEYLRRASGKG